MQYFYYLHFEKTHPVEDIRALFPTDSPAEVEQIFESSFDIVTALSFSKVKHLIRSAYPIERFYLLQARRGDLRTPLGDSPD